VPELITQPKRRRSRTAALLLLATLALFVFAGYFWYRAGGLAPFSAPRVTTLPRSPAQVVPGIYILPGLGPSVAYVVESSQGLVLVDSGDDDDAARIKSKMAALRLDWKRVRAILLTHAHSDHTNGAEALRAATGARVYAGAGDALVLKEGQNRDAVYGIFFKPHRSLHPTTIDVALQGDETLTFGDVRIRALATPGHTPGSVCYLLERKNLRALFAGDVIMMLRGDEKPLTETRKPLGTYSAYLAPRYRGNANDSLASLRSLRSLPVPDLVLPGHPGADVTPQSPYLSQSSWESLLDQGIHDMETLLGRYQADGALFLDGVPKRLLPDMYYLGDFKGACIYGFFASSKFFLVDAPGGPGLLEFVGTRLRQLGREPVAPTAVLLTSCSGNETAGLPDLVQKAHTQVVALSPGIDRWTESCPPGSVFVAAEELPKKGWFPVTIYPLGGRGFAPCAYQLSWGGKTVLFSGKIPISLEEDLQVRLIADLTRSKDDLRSYFLSITELDKLNPNLWLPSTSVIGQNANLYDRDWKQLLANNLIVIKYIVDNFKFL
jgi:glyoxylase-like metal-dependent hydrolase (beta-lactamase superfamily II)